MHHNKWEIDLKVLHPNETSVTFSDNQATDICWQNFRQPMAIFRH